MFQNISMTGVGAIITILESLVKLFNIEIPEGSIASAVNGIVSLIGIVFVIIGQFRRKDLVGGLIRKTKV